MAQCKQSAQEFIQDVFSPMVAVLSSHDAEVVCQRNNLTFVELIQPFCRLNTEAQIRDSGNMTHTIRNLKITVRDMGQLPPQPTLAKKLMNEAVANALPANFDSNRANIMSVGDYDLQISASTPWYEAFRDCFHTVLYPSDHEYIRHYLACMFVVSSSHADPMDQFHKLKQQQMQQQQSTANSVPKWFCPNVLHYYVLVHDVCHEQENKAESIYQQMKNQFGVNTCHLLHINSRRGEAGTEGIPDPWSQFLSKKHEFPEHEFEPMMSQDGDGGASFPSQVTEGANSGAAAAAGGAPAAARQQQLIESAMEATEDEASDASDAGAAATIDHPLAVGGVAGDDDDATSALLTSGATLGGAGGGPESPNPLTDRAKFTHKRSKSGSHGSCLSLSDHDRLRILVHEFVVRGLIPWAERTLRTLNEMVVPRKGLHRSLFSGAKKWFGGNKGSPPTSVAAAEKTNVIYTSEAPEIQLRRLADLAFMFQLYEVAYQTYHAAKRDFNNDHAWLHFAGAREMAGVSVFLQGSTSQRQFPHHYMESAISTYLSCRNTLFATRATLLYTEALKSKSMYEEAAMQYIKMTSEDSDLRSALLLEQASHCFIRMKTPMVRKYAFHMILAGHRFSKSGQRRHALRSYAQALQVLVYKGKSWSLAEDHINFTLGRQSFNLKQPETAAAAFRHLLTAESRQSPAQQAAFLREFLYVYKQHLTSSSPDGATLPQLPLPVADGNATKILTCPPADPSNAPSSLHQPASSVGFGSASDDADDAADSDSAAVWTKLEQLAVAAATGSLPLSWRPCVQCHTQRTQNNASPVAVVNECVLVEVRLQNPLKIPLILSDLRLLWSFVGSGDPGAAPPPAVSNEGPHSPKESLSSGIVETESLSEVTINGSEVKKLVLRLTPREPGDLHITGLAYSLGTPAPPSDTAGNAADAKAAAALTVRGKVNLEVQGPRLNGSKDEKAAKMYGPDRRLDLVVVPPAPRLEVWLSAVPPTLLCGEVRPVAVTLRNAGAAPTATGGLRVASTHPECFTFAPPGGDISSSSSDAAAPAVYSPATSDAAVSMVPSTPRHVTFLPGVGSLAPGASVTLPMWVRGPATPGNHTLRLLFYYEPNSGSSNGKGVRHRVVRHEIRVAVSPSLSLTAAARRANHTTHTEVKQQGSAEVTSGSAEVTSGSAEDSLTVSLQIANVAASNTPAVAADSAPPPATFSLLQVSCASTCGWHLHHLSPTTTQQPDVSGGESSLMCLRATRRQHQQQHGDVLFTNVAFGQQEIASAQSPCSDFYLRSLIHTKFDDVEVEVPKPATIIENTRPSRASKLQPLNCALEANLTLIVLWKASVSGEEVRGQHHVSLERLDTPVTAPNVPKISLEQATLKIIKDEPADDPDLTLTPEVAGSLLKYSLQYTQNVTHDFSHNRLCPVAVTVTLHNCCREQLSVDVSTTTHQTKNSPATASPSSSSDLPAPSSSRATGAATAQPGAMFLWGGQTTTHADVAASSTHSLTLKAIIPAPGVYDLSATLSVHASPHTDASLRALQKPSTQYVVVVKDERHGL